MNAPMASVSAPIDVAAARYLLRVTVPTLPVLRHLPLGALIAALVLAALYALRLVVFGRQAPVVGLLLGAQAIVTAALLGLAVWRVQSGGWWHRIRPVVRVAAHVLLALLFALTWALAHLFTTELLVTREVAHRAWLTMGWELLAGLMLYGLTAAVVRVVELSHLVARAELLAAEARLAALRARLQPHFLFNALHSISGLVPHDPGVATRGIEQLGALLRTSIDEQRPVVTLREDWAFTAQYLDLERLRLGARLTVATDIAPEALACEVPVFTLQPIVENALSHGLGPKPGPVRLSVSAGVHDRTLVLEVVDDGVGADATALGRPNGSGLRVLNERLRAAHGAAAKVDVTTQPGAGFRVRVTLPALRNGDD